MFAFLRGRLAAIYAAGVIGALLQIAGGYWDVAWHILGIVETFFTPPHTILYTGVAVAGFACLCGVLLRLTAMRSDPRRHLLTGLQIAFVGGAMQAVAGPMDFWWHETFGFDPHLFTPSHLLLILGIVLVGFGMAIGIVRLRATRARGVGIAISLTSPRAMNALAVVALTTLWLDLNILVYLLTDVGGIEYTFNLPSSFSNQFGTMAAAIAYTALALTGTLVFLTAKRVLATRGTVTTIALLSATITASANLAFRAFTPLGGAENTVPASFIPVYLSFLVPVFLYDRLVAGPASRWWIVGAALVAPFASYLDGWYASVMWTNVTFWNAVLAVPMMIAGLAAAALHGPFEGFLSARNRAAPEPAA